MDQNPFSQTYLSDQSGRMENHINMGLKLILREDIPFSYKKKLPFFLLKYFQFIKVLNLFLKCTTLFFNTNITRQFP